MPRSARRELSTAQIDYLSDPEVRTALSKVAALLRGFDGLIKDIESIHRLVDTFTPFMPAERSLRPANSVKAPRIRPGSSACFGCIALAALKASTGVQVENFTFQMFTILLDKPGAASSAGFPDIADPIESLKKEWVRIQLQQKIIKQLDELFAALYYSEQPRKAV